MEIFGVEVNPRRTGPRHAYLTKTQFQKILREATGIEYRCDGRYTDDYAFDAAYNFGKTDWLKFDPEPLKKENMSRKEPFGIGWRLKEGWYPGLYYATYDGESNWISFTCGSSESFTFRKV